MSRLIDADYMRKLVDIHGTNKYGMLDENIRVFIDQQPSVDAVEVVRCKDCRWWERDYQPRYHPDERPCNRVGMGTSPDWFCADGKRKGEEG